MQPFLLLLLLAYSVTSTFTSAVTPNILGRGVAMTSYTITPLDSTNTANIESRLNQYYDDSNIVTNRQDGRIVSWTLTSSNQDVVSLFESIEGVRSVEPHYALGEMPRRELAAHDQSEPHKISAYGTINDSDDLSKRDVPTYMALAANDSDTKQTEAFLKSKVQQPDGIIRLQWRGEEVMGWYNLFLDDKALEEVRSYEGIKQVKVPRKFEDFRYLPSNDRLKLRQKKRKLLDSDAVLARRAGSWEKQDRADKALVMDSQYKYV
jgi:hypothetical protein